VRIVLLVTLGPILMLVPDRARAQDAPRPVIDTIILQRQNIFPKDQARESFPARAGNAIHRPTASWVVRSTLLFRVGDTLDMARVEESERALRALDLFQVVTIDTATRNGKLAVLIHTQDAWSLSPVFSIAGSGGDVTLTLGLSEKNFFGTGVSLSAAYVKLVDRDGLDLAASMPRMGASRLSLGGTYQNTSVGNTGSLDAGVPYRASPDPWSAMIHGNAADELRFRFAQTPGGLDSTTFQHNLLSNQLTTSIALQHSPERYLRAGVNLLVRSEEYIAQPAPAVPVSDSLTATAGLALDYRRSEFMTGYYYQGFGQAEDIDLSTNVAFTAWLAPQAFGYASTGLGPELHLSDGTRIGPTVLVAALDASGLVNGGGLDSGTVRLRTTWSTKLARKQMAFLHVEAGAMKDEPPGKEFDLGLTYGPRTFGAHAFVGDRTLWGTLEWRDYRWEDVFGFLGIGYAAFVDYGGAWYDTQPRRWGGNVGAGLRLGSTIASKASAAKIDVGYRFGPGFAGKRWGVSFGGSYDIFLQ